MGGLSARALAFSALALACGLAVGGYLTWVLGLPYESVSVLIYASTIPLWALAFWEPDGMRPERWLPLFLRHHLGASMLTYGTRGRYATAYETNGRRGQDPPASARHGSAGSHPQFRRRKRGG